jgi:hypothetical protein
MKELSRERAEDVQYWLTSCFREAITVSKEAGLWTFEITNLTKLGRAFLANVMKELPKGSYQLQGSIFKIGVKND